MNLPKKKRKDQSYLVRSHSREYKDGKHLPINEWVWVKAHWRANPKKNKAR